MKRLMIPMVLLGGLTLGGAALAADSATTQVTYAGVKVGIDAKTGALRPLTAAESRKLDLAMTGGKQSHISSLHFVTRKEALASQKRTIGRGVSMKLPSDQNVGLTATKHADGTISFSEGGKSEELPNE